jgi:hypothetical protein
MVTRERTELLYRQQNKTGRHPAAMIDAGNQIIN